MISIYPSIFAILGICFISATTRGVFAQLFCDFGNFEIVDKNGEENREVLVGNISREEEAVVTCLNNEKHGFEDGDTVTFREVQGMTNLNNNSVYKIRATSPSTFVLTGTNSTSWPIYTREGIVSQTKAVVAITHVSIITIVSYICFYRYGY